METMGPAHLRSFVTRSEDLTDTRGSAGGDRGARLRMLRSAPSAPSGTQWISPFAGSPRACGLPWEC